MLAIGIITPSGRFHPLLNAAAICAYFSGIAFASLHGSKDSHHRTLIVIELLFLTIAALSFGFTSSLTMYGSDWVSVLAILVTIVFASAAMGIQGTLIDRIGGVPISTNYMTGTLTRIVSDISGRTCMALHLCTHGESNAAQIPASHSGKPIVSILLPVFFSFFAGAICAALLIPYSRGIAILIPVILILILAVLWTRNGEGCLFSFFGACCMQ
jgi:uncharacterized membrane protein YoaK (UPF0700 family)